MLLCIIETQAFSDEYSHGTSHRELRGGRGGGGRSSSSSSSSRSSYKPTSSTSYKTSYLKSAPKDSYTGTFKDGKSYSPIYAYYLPVGYYNPTGYYSPLYMKIYYNGYGYNFYTGAYSYY